MHRSADTVGDRRLPSSRRKALEAQLHRAAAALRHSANIIDLAAASEEPEEGTAYLRLSLIRARDDLRALPSWAHPHSHRR